MIDKTMYSLKKAARIVGATERNIRLWATQMLGEVLTMPPGSSPEKNKRVYQVRLVNARNLLQLAACSALRYLKTVRSGHWAAMIDGRSSYVYIHPESEGWQPGEAGEVADQLAQHESMLVLNVRALEGRVTPERRKIEERLDRELGEIDARAERALREMGARADKRHRGQRARTGRGGHG